MRLDEYRQELKIPHERVAVLIGKKGEIRRKIERKAKIKLEIDSETGDVALIGQDSVTLYETVSVIKAIGRGFAPETAMLLFKEGYSFELIDITEYSGKSRKKLDRLRGRVIGHDGKSRSMIAGLTETNMVIYGKTVGIIGEIEWVGIARRAVELLLGGSPHGNVYKWLEKKRRELNRQNFEQP